MRFAHQPLLLSRLASLGLALGLTLTVLWGLGSEAHRQHGELAQAKLQRGSLLAQSCSLPNTSRLPG